MFATKYLLLDVYKSEKEEALEKKSSNGSFERSDTPLLLKLVCD